MKNLLKSIVLVICFMLLATPICADVTNTPTSARSPVIYALHLTNGTSEMGEIQVIPYPSPEPPMWVFYPRALSAADDRAYLVKGLCGDPNPKIVKPLEEGPVPIGLDLQGHEHVLATKYRSWVLFDNAGGPKLTDNHLSVVVRESGTKKIEWCGNLMRNNEITAME